jgi:hypothetical protein
MRPGKAQATHMLFQVSPTHGTRCQHRARRTTVKALHRLPKMLHGKHNTSPTQPMKPCLGDVYAGTADGITRSSQTSLAHETVVTKVSQTRLSRNPITSYLKSRLLGRSARWPALFLRHCMNIASMQWMQTQVSCCELCTARPLVRPVVTSWMLSTEDITVHFDLLSQLGMMHYCNPM